jgi:CubicO group peptidase (beta-lactamase class C family)
MRNKRLLLLSALLSLCFLLASIHGRGAYAQDASQTVWPTKEWLTSTPEEQGMGSAALAKLVAFGGSHSFDSLLVVRHGRIVLEAYYAPYSADIPHVINSCTKAVVGTLVGMAYKDGLLDRLDHPVLDFFADRNIANIDDGKKAITVQNLLDMTSGLDWDEGFEGGKEQSLDDLGRSPNWTQFILDRPMAHTPGELFYYDSGNPHLLSAILTKLTGKNAEDYAKEKLFEPLGITTWRWRRDPQGLSTGGFGLTLFPRDMAKIGLLYLHRGEWDGKQLLPPGWADVLTHATVNMGASFDPNLRYSNLFWVFPNRRVYMAVGYHGQLIAMFPDLDIVAAVTARNFVPFGKLSDYISSAVKSDTALPPDGEATHFLADTIERSTAENPTQIGATPEIAAAISGKTYKFPDNFFRIKSLTLFLTDSHPHYDAEIYTHGPTNSSIRYNGLIGLDGLYRKSSSTMFGIVPTVKGTWLDGQTFEMDVEYLGYGEEQKLFLSFAADKLNLRGKDRDGREASVEGELSD